MTAAGRGPTTVPEGDRSPGCLRLVAAGVALAVLAPVTALVRMWRRRRRPVRFRVSVAGAVAAAPGATRLDLRAEVPSDQELAWRARLTDTVVRLAEALRSPDDVYHLLYRVPGEPEAVLVAIGPQLQELGERFSLALGQLELAGRTAVWLVLPRRCHVATVVDPFTADPEAAGEPDRLLTTPALRWGLATEWQRRDDALHLRLLADVPVDNAATARAVLARLAT